MHLHHIPKSLHIHNTELQCAYIPVEVHIHLETHPPKSATIQYLQHIAFTNITFCQKQLLTKAQ